VDGDAGPAGQIPPAAPGASATGAPVAPPDVFPKQGDDSFAEAIEVNVVSIDVGVRDKSGRQVAGLTRDDFTLFVDGQKVADHQLLRRGRDAGVESGTIAAVQTVATPEIRGVARGW